MKMLSITFLFRRVRILVFYDDYLIKYMLEWETKETPTLSMLKSSLVLDIS
jgi:hypothetical protein